LPTATCQQRANLHDRNALNALISFPVSVDALAKIRKESSRCGLTGHLDRNRDDPTSDFVTNSRKAAKAGSPRMRRCGDRWHFVGAPCE